MKINILRNAGFTLVEVLIASAIVMGAMGLLLSLFASGLDRMQRVGEQAHLIVAEKEIVARLSLLNPAEQGSGAGKLGDWRYSWSARAISSFRHINVQLGEIPYPRYVALFAINIEITRSGRKEARLRIERMGWRSSP